MATLHNVLAPTTRTRTQTTYHYRSSDDGDMDR